MAEVKAKFTLDISQVRAAFADVKKLFSGAQAAAGSGGGAGPMAAAGSAARSARGQFQAVGREAAAANVAMERTQGVAGRAFAAIRAGGRAAVAVGAVTVALVALNRKFPAIGEVAGRAFGMVRTATAGAARATGGFFRDLAGYLPAAAKAALAIRGLVLAFRLLRAAPKPGPVKFPAPGGGGSGGGGFSPGRLIGAAAAGLGVAALAGGAFSMAREGIATALQGAAAQEQLQISFEVLTGGLEPAKKALASIRTLSENTPLKFADLAGAGRSLVAFGENADALPETLRRIGDISSGVGAGIGDIAEIYGKARVQGTLFAEDINQLTGRGIPVIQEFANILGTTPDQIKKMASEGKITFPLLEKAFANMTGKGGVFGGMMDRLSRTVGGLWSTLTDRITTALTALGQPINDALRPLLAEAVNLAGGLKEKAAAFGEGIAQAVDFLRAALATLSAGDVWEAVGLGLKLAFQSAVDFLMRAVSALFTALGAPGRLEGLRENLLDVASLFGEALLGALKFALQGLATLQGVGGVFAGAAEAVGTAETTLAALRQSRADSRAAAEARGPRFGERFETVPDGKGGTKAVKAGFLSDFKDAFAKSRGSFEESNKGLAARLSSVLAPAMAQAVKNTAERTGATESGAVVPEKPKPEGLIPVSSGASFVGAFQRGINILTGRTVNELVAAEAQKGNDLLRAMNGHAEKTKRATEETAKNTRKPAPVSVSVVPTFG